MSFQISDICLYGPAETPRVLTLEPGKMNIITGSSKTGKSSLISIIDYCLGRGKCLVPDGPIRASVEWYALRLILNEHQLFVARRAPRSGRESSAEVYFETADIVAIPDKSELTATTNVDALVQLLSRAAGIVDNLHDPPAGATRTALSASLRHALFFCFQPQDEIISRRHLFYRQTEQFIPQAIQDVLPYFMGVIDDDYIVKKEQLRRLRRELKQVARKLAEDAAIRGEFSARVSALLGEARDLGLVEIPDEEMSQADAVQLLRVVQTRGVPSAPEFDPSTDATVYEALLAERETLTSRYRRVTQDLRSTHELVRARQGYSNEGGQQTSRLASIGLFDEVAPSGAICPLCSSDVHDLPSTSELQETLSGLQGNIDRVGQDVPHLERLIQEIEQQAQELRDDLRGNNEKVLALQESQRRLADYRDHAARWAHVQGRISLYLETVPEVQAEPSDLVQRAELLARRIARLEEELSDEAMRERLDSVLSILSSHISDWGKALDLEHSQHPMRFDARKLTVIADTPLGPVPMERMGSGANWVGYHIVVHLALHKLFVSQGRPVPRFVFFDQPSQVYFPADRDLDGQLQGTDEDRTAVVRMFELIKDVAAELAPGLQVIVTEHADPAEDWYQEAVVERWRGGEALIPADWIDVREDIGGG